MFSIFRRWPITGWYMRECSCSTLSRNVYVGPMSNVQSFSRPVYMEYWNVLGELAIGGITSADHYAGTRAAGSELLFPSLCFPVTLDVWWKQKAHKVGWNFLLIFMTKMALIILTALYDHDWCPSWRWSCRPWVPGGRRRGPPLCRHRNCDRQWEVMIMLLVMFSNDMTWRLTYSSCVCMSTKAEQINAVWYHQLYHTITSSLPKGVPAVVLDGAS